MNERKIEALVHTLLHELAYREIIEYSYKDRYLRKIIIIKLKELPKEVLE